MASRVRIEFLGLTGVVPNAENGSGDPDSYTVVIPDLEHGLSDPRLPRVGGRQSHIAPHVSAVVVPAASVIPDSDKKPSLIFRSASGPYSDQDYHLYVLKQEKLELDGTVAIGLDAPNDPVNPNDPTTISPIDNETSQGLQWIPRLSLANLHGEPQTGKLDRDRFLNPDGSPRHTGDLSLAATIPVTSGRFFVNGVFSSEGSPTLFKMAAPGVNEPAWSQAIYQNIVWDTAAANDSLDLVFTNGVDFKSERVSLRAPDGLKIRVANLELEQLLKVGAHTVPRSGSDIDYAVSYLLCNEVPSPEAMPVPVVDTGVGGSTSPRCTSAMFDG